MADTTQELLALNQRLLDSIAGGDWATYQELCDPSLTAVEPESHGQVIEGLNSIVSTSTSAASAAAARQRNALRMSVSWATPLLSSTRGSSSALTPTGGVHSATSRRALARKDGKWRHVHFHRTPLAG